MSGPTVPTGMSQYFRGLALAELLQTLRRARRSVVDAHPRNLHIRCLRGHCYGNLSLSSTPQYLFTAGAMSSDPTAGMY